MRPWMKIFLSILLISSTALADCSFKKDVKKVVSLSGAISVILSEIGLLNSSAILGISHYHPVGPQKYSGKRYPGGIFLAPSTLDEFSGAAVFYDESRELKKILETRRNVTSIEVKTRNLLPLEALEHSISVVLPFLTGCEGEVSRLRNHGQLLQDKLLERVPAGTKAYFYLGKINPPRFPELMMVQDGAVKLLQQEKKITTYPSPLSYVNWSSKIHNESTKDTLHVGIIDSGDREAIDLAKKGKFHNLTYPGALVPGLSQLRAFHFWANSL
jgi:hypothetical protein